MDTSKHNFRNDCFNNFENWKSKIQGAFRVTIFKMGEQHWKERSDLKIHSHMYGDVIRHVCSLSQVVYTHKRDNMSYQVLTFVKVQ